MTTLLDSGTQVSLIDCALKQKYLPQQVIQELILGQEGGIEVVAVTAKLLREENNKTNAIVSFVQTQEPIQSWSTQCHCPP